MVRCNQVLSEYPVSQLSPANLGEFSRLIEDAYHADVQHGLSLSCRLDVLNCIIERFGRFIAFPESQIALDLWLYRRRKLLSADGKYYE